MSTLLMRFDSEDGLSIFMQNIAVIKGNFLFDGSFATDKMDS